MTIGTLKEYKTNLFQLGRQSSPVLCDCPGCGATLLSPKYKSDFLECPQCLRVFDDAMKEVRDVPDDVEEVQLYDA